MKLKITKRYKGFPFIEISTRKYHFVILLWVNGKFEKWQIKKVFYNTVYKFHPFEMCWYY
jgi:hypothetical protein